MNFSTKWHASFVLTRRPFFLSVPGMTYGNALLLVAYLSPGSMYRYGYSTYFGRRTSFISLQAMRNPGSKCRSLKDRNHQAIVPLQMLQRMLQPGYQDHWADLTSRFILVFYHLHHGSARIQKLGGLLFGLSLGVSVVRPVQGQQDLSRETLEMRSLYPYGSK